MEIRKVKALVVGAGPGGYPCAIRLGQLGAFFQRYGHAVDRMPQQVVLCEETREEHSMPLLVGALLD